MLPNGVFNEAVFKPTVARHYTVLYLCNDDDLYRSRSNTWYLSLLAKSLLCQTMVV